MQELESGTDLLHCSAFCSLHLNLPSPRGNAPRIQLGAAVLRDTSIWAQEGVISSSEASVLFILFCPIGAVVCQIQMLGASSLRPRGQ